MKQDKFYKIDNGYTLLFSIIVASIVLSIAAFILSVSRKQFVLSSISRDSTMAIYAADSAMQCMVSAQYAGTLDATVTDSNGVVTIQTPSVFCMGATLNSPSSKFIVKTGNGGDPTYNLQNDEVNIKIYQTGEPILFDFSNDSCAMVTITEGREIGNTNDKERKVIIESRGYNNKFSLPCDKQGVYNPRTVERAIRVIYRK